MSKMLPDFMLHHLFLVELHPKLNLHLPKLKPHLLALKHQIVRMQALFIEPKVVFLDKNIPEIAYSVVPREFLYLYTRNLFLKTPKPQGFH